MKRDETDWFEYRRLWRDAFGDTEKYMDYYFHKKASRSIIYEDRREGELCSMAFFTMYDAVLRGKPCRLPYIVGVATDKNRRHEGRMTRTLLTGMEEMSKQGCPLVFLSPADPAIYAHLGFEPGYERQTTIWEKSGHSTLQIQGWDSLQNTQKIQVAAFAKEQLKNEMFDLYLDHHEQYYHEVNQELKALNGELLVLFDQETIVGVANWIVEEGRNEVTELICSRDMAGGVMESLHTWCGGDALIVDDSTFIDHLKGNGIRHKKQEIPYLMYCFLKADSPLRLRCYINDIT